MRKCLVASFVVHLAAGCGAGARPPDDDGRCPTARGNDLLAQERRGYEATGPSLPPPPSPEVFNRAAEELELPFRWAGDTNGDGRVAPDELLFGRDADADGHVSTAEITLRGGGSDDPWVKWLPMTVHGGPFTAYFTSQFAAAYLRIVTHASAPTGSSAPAAPDAPGDPKTL